MRLLLASLAAFLWSFPALAQEVGQGSPGALVATDDQATTTRLVRGVLSDPRYGYRPIRFDDAVSARIFDAYIEALDGDKLYLSTADLAALPQARGALADGITRGDLAPAFAIFAMLRKAADERAAFAKKILADPSGFEGPGSWQPNRSRAARATDHAGLDALWRDLVRHDALELKMAGRTRAQIGQLLDDRYAAMARRIAGMTEWMVVETFLDASARVADEGNAYYRPGKPMDWSDLMSVGIGLGLVQRGPYPEVSHLAPGGPAQANGGPGLGDRLLAIAEGDAALEDVAGLPFDEIARRLRGKPGSTVRLQLLPAQGAARTVVLVRDAVKSQAEKSMVLVGGRKIGVIRPNSLYMDFEGKRKNPAGYASVSRDVGRMLGELGSEGAEGLVIDLRGNEGGALSEVVALADLFLPGVAILQIREAGGRVSLERDNPGSAWAGPLAVLVDAGTAAGAEMFAAAIQDHHRGLVIGQRTHGRGTIQNLLDLDRPLNGTERPRFGMLKLTIAEAFRPNGDNLEPGVAPDIEFLPAPGAAKPARRIPPVAGMSHRATPPAGVADLVAAHRSRAGQPGEFQRWRDRKLAEQAVRERNRVTWGGQARQAEVPLPVAGPTGDDAVELHEAAAVMADALPPKR